MYLTKKRSTEILLWVLILTAIGLINATTEIIEAVRDDELLPVWQSFAGEFTSVFIVGFLVPVILYIDQRIPIAGETG